MTKVKRSWKRKVAYKIYREYIFHVYYPQYLGSILILSAYVISASHF